MQSERVYILYGYIELLPVEAGFVIPVFEHEDDLYLQISKDEININDFELIPVHYKEIVTAKRASYQIVKGTGNDCLFAFKWNNEVWFYGYNNLFSSLSVVSSDNQADARLKECIIAFRNRYSMYNVDWNKITSVGDVEELHKVEAIESNAMHGRLKFKEGQGNLGETEKLVLTKQKVYEFSLKKKDFSCSIENGFTCSYRQSYVNKGRLIEENFHISIRLFYMRNDAGMVAEWVSKKHALLKYTSSGIRQILETYAMIAESDFAKSFIVLMNNQPVSNIDIYLATHHELSLYYDYRPGDFVIDLLVPSQKSRISNLIFFTLNAFLRYVFSFKEVKRIIMEVNVHDKGLRQVLEKTGFSNQRFIKSSCIYACTRHDFCHKTF
jgi:hypothetical protein